MNQKHETYTWEQFTNALEWYSKAPSRWYTSAKTDLSAAAEWIWEVLQGDFNDDQTTAQIATGMVISMIPIVDQICDVRDLVANCKKIDSEPNNEWAWFALVLTLLGLFPSLGSLLKGVVKILFSQARHTKHTVVKKVAENQAIQRFWAPKAQAVEEGIRLLGKHFNNPAVQKTLKALKIDNAWRYTAKHIRALSSKLTAKDLLSAFDALIEVLNKLLGTVKKYGSPLMATKVGLLLGMVAKVRNMADQKLADMLHPIKSWLDEVARRLDVEADNLYRANTNAKNIYFERMKDTDELAKFEKEKPEWVDKGDDGRHRAAKKYIPKAGWPDLNPVVPPGERHPLKEAYKTFKEGDIHPVTIPPGEVLYRVVDPKSGDNAICWMRKVEFDQLTSKADWRRRFAVWASWNTNGEFVTYTVPPGKGLNVWEGAAASQQMRQTDYWLEGGSKQIVLDPNDLKKGFLGKRQLTQWGYDDLGQYPDMRGAPTLLNHWFEPKEKK
jgi:hypothetical protein